MLVDICMSWIRNCLEEGLRMSVKSDAVMEIELVNATDVHAKDGKVTDRGLNVLNNAEHWFMDGTFKTAPGLFYQLYTVHCMTNDRVIPCVYALLPNKRQNTYDRLFNEIINLAPVDVRCY